MCSWVPHEVVSEDLTALGWWQPAAVAEWLGHRPEWDQLSYVVVDELHEGVAGLVVSQWPRVDERGRLHFGDEETSVAMATPAEALLAVLRERRLPIMVVTLDAETEEELPSRQLAIGDVFAARVRTPPGHRRGRAGGGPDGGTPFDPRSWLGDEILDITAEAMDIAKTQAAAATAGAFDEAFLTIVEAEWREDDGPPTTPRPTPAPDRGGPSEGGAAPAHEPKAGRDAEKEAGAESPETLDSDADELAEFLQRPGRREMQSRERREVDEDEGEGETVGA